MIMMTIMMMMMMTMMMIKTMMMIIHKDNHKPSHLIQYEDNEEYSSSKKLHAGVFGVL